MSIFSVLLIGHNGLKHQFFQQLHLKHKLVKRKTIRSSPRLEEVNHVTLSKPGALHYLCTTLRKTMASTIYLHHGVPFRILLHSQSTLQRTPPNTQTFVSQSSRHKRWACLREHHVSRQLRLSVVLLLWFWGVNLP